MYRQIKGKFRIQYVVPYCTNPNSFLTVKVTYCLETVKIPD
jgi:hypothetical protein